MRGLRVPALRDVPYRDEHDGHGEGQVDEEHPAPAHGLHQPAPQERAGRAGDAGQPGPGADGAHPVLGAEGRLQDRQAARRQQCSADALDRAGGDESADVGRDSTGQRRDGEPHDADHEHPPPAEPVAERAAEQDQGGEGQRVGVDGPLQARDPRVQVLTDGGQRDVDDRAVDERHPRAEDGGREHPAASGPAEGQQRRRGRGGALRHVPRHVAAMSASNTRCAGSVRAGSG